MAKEQEKNTYIIGSPDKYTEYSIKDGSIVLCKLPQKLAPEENHLKEQETSSEVISTRAVSKPIAIPPPNSQRYDSTSLPLFEQANELTAHSLDLLGGTYDLIEAGA